MLITQIELGTRAGDDLPFGLVGVMAQQRSPDEALMTGDEKFAA
jgi:hypothetical protein